MANAQLHEALKVLRPKDFASDVPADDLEPFMRNIFANTELIVNSLPQPLGGTDFLSSKRQRTDVNGAHGATEMTNSDARAPPFDPSFEDLPKSWGKPIKSNPNPLAVSVFKMAGSDRYGSWFARRSVHEGLGFTKWKKALQREFAESLAVQGGPGAGCIRGIGGDKRLERTAVEGVGQLEGMFATMNALGRRLTSHCQLQYSNFRQSSQPLQLHASSLPCFLPRIMR